MYSKELIDKLMYKKNYTQYKQAAEELGFSKQHISTINSGKAEITDETAIYIAKECDLDVKEVLLKLAEARAKTKETKEAWSAIIQKLAGEKMKNKSIEIISLAGLLPIITTTLNTTLC
ncbi:DUF3693 domain-containing protein [Zobellella denitrificans]|uniref:DUF3693 domain-containing protein n=1 Tax=Zobellella denitrificans TaxID=347534 RepID=UPI000BBE9C3A|nr:DUF3693 domain-containing protein [Zobellella denitrificans]